MVVFRQPKWASSPDPWSLILFLSNVMNKNRGFIFHLAMLLIPSSYLSSPSRRVRKWFQEPGLTQQGVDDMLRNSVKPKEQRIGGKNRFQVRVSLN